MTLGARLPPATHVGAVHLQVADLSRSLEYYRDRLGFHVLASGAHDALLGVEEEQPLIELRERPGARHVPASGVLGLFHFAVLLPDRAALGRFLTHLSTTGTRVASADHLVSEALYLWDPDGLGIEVYADRPRGSWRMRNGELVMVTEPLDLVSVADAGAGEPWSGFPPATTMGHVHLQVGDLADARGFYHGALGLDVTVWSYPGALFMSAGGYHHHVATNVWAARPRRATDEDARLLEWELVLPEIADVNRVAASLTAHGHVVTADSDDRLVTDPWGTPLRLRAARSI